MKPTILGRRWWKELPLLKRESYSRKACIDKWLPRGFCASFTQFFFKKNNSIIGSQYVPSHITQFGSKEKEVGNACAHTYPRTLSGVWFFLELSCSTNTWEILMDFWVSLLLRPKANKLFSIIFIDFVCLRTSKSFSVREFNSPWMYIFYIGIWHTLHIY